ncbi:MAG TPA: hypothetical protein VMD29_14075 [Terracidiphilus sp.]|nr:hypothetical protein [Terracidiphilus sp.]
MSPSHQKTVGYQDEQGVFHPFNQAVPDTVAKTDYTGTLDVTIHITVKSTFKTGTIIACGTEALVSSYSETNPLAGLSYEEWDYAEATGSGTSYTCTLKIPYSWSLLSPGTGVANSMSATYEVLALAPSGSIFSTGNGLRYTAGPLATSASIPAIGATTSYTINATI